MYDKVVTSQSSSSWEAFKKNCSSFSLDEGSTKILPEVDSSRFFLDIVSLKILLVGTSFSFLLSKIPLDGTSLYFLLDKVYPLLDVESSEDHSSTKILMSNEIVGLDFSFSSRYNSYMKLLKILIGFLNSFLYLLAVESTC